MKLEIAAAFALAWTLGPSLRAGEFLDTPRIQEMHLLCAHIICELIEDSVKVV